MPKGYNGKILRVDLTRRTISVDEPDEKVYRTYFGGQGLTAYTLLQEQPAGVDALGPENRLIFAPGIVTGAPLPGSGRHGMGGKSPLTGGIIDSHVGGYWGAELKRAGYDAIIVQGQSDEPVYLWVQDGEAEIRDASHLWGQTTGEAQAAIRTELGDKNIRVAQIGPGGENVVLYACVMNDLKDAAGRGGSGAVMGSKKLKAIAVRGHKYPELADPEKVRGIAKWFVDTWKSTWRIGLHELGTAAGLRGNQELGSLPTFNFREGQFDGAEKISGETMRDSILIDRDSCFACPIRCKRVVRVDEPYKVDPQYGGPEYETLASFGSVCGVDDLAAIARANQLCNAYTIDAISTGMSIAFAMECFENGLLAEKDTGGIRLTFGNADGMLQTIELIARRQGIGDLLAQGVKRAAEAIGQGAEQCAIHVKGVEFPMHEPRVKMGMGLGYAVSSIGADHMQGLNDAAFVSRSPTSLGVLDPLPLADLSPEKVRLFVYLQYLWAFLNCALICDHCNVYDAGILGELVRGLTGWDTNAWELMKVGERALNMSRAFNVREGLGKAQDTLPDRMFTPHPNTPPYGVAIDRDDFVRARQDYYAMMGWDAEGVPTESKLRELGVGWVVEKLKDVR